jgi:RHS repeat-associated protein
VFFVGPGRFQPDYIDGAAGPSASDLYGNSNMDDPWLCRPCDGDPVNNITANFTETYADLELGGLGLGLGLERTYNSQAARSATSPGPFGYGWTASYLDRLAVNPNSGNVTITHGDDSTVEFTANGDGTYSPAPWVQSTLRHNGDGTWTYTLPDQTVFSFDSNGALTSEQDRNANRTTLTYSAGQLTAITDPVGRSITLAYNADGTVGQATGPGSKTVQYTYTNGDLTAVHDVGGKVTSFAYDTTHQLTGFTDPRSNTTTNVYDTQGRVTSQTAPSQRTTRWTYLADETKVTDPVGNVKDEQFQHNMPTSVTLGYGTSDASTQTWSYGASLNPTEIVDGRGHHWQYAYDGAGNRTSVTDPLNHTTTYTYDDKHDETSVTDPRNHLTSFTYDAPGNLETTSTTLAETGDVATTHYSYDPSGNGELRTVSDPLGHEWNYGYDNQGDLSSVTSPEGRQTTFSYDVNSWLRTTTTPRGNVAGANPADYTTTYARNDYGNSTDVQQPSGPHTLFAYDSNQNLTDVTDADLRHTHVVFNEANEPTDVQRPDGSFIRTDYDGDGQITSQTDGLLKSTNYRYDHVGRLSLITDPKGRSESRSYDRAGNLTGVNDALGHTTTFNYDEANELTGISYSTGSPGDVALHYSADGQRTSMVDDSGTTAYTYDSLNRLTSQTSGAGQMTTYGYDLANRVASIGYPDALMLPDVNGGAEREQVAEGTVTRGYDHDGNLTSVTDWLGHTTTFTYSRDDQITDVTRPNGTSASYGFDRDGFLTSLTDAAGQIGYGRTAAGLLDSQTPAGGPTQSAVYDGSRRLRSLGAATYQYDAADNPTQVVDPSGQALTQSFDDANELSTISAGATTLATLTYDDRGDRTSSTDQNGVATGYTWDQANHLVGYSGPDHANPGQTTSAQFAYDGDGLRQTKTGVSRLWEAYDIVDGLPSMIDDGLTAYITGPGGLPIEQVAADGSALYFSQDQIGSTTALTDQGGSAVATYSYDAYGNVTSHTGSATTPFGYAGQYTDSQTGLQYLRARYYDPATAEFLSRDQLSPLTREPYSYAADSPSNLADPSGLSPFSGALHTVGTWAVGAWNGVNGAADTLTSPLGLVGLPTTAGLRNSWGGLGVDTCSSFYQGGGLVGLGLSLAIPGDGEAEAATLAARAGEEGSGLSRLVERIYEPNPKHGRFARSDSRGREISRAPRGDAQAILDQSVQDGPNTPHRVGTEPETGMRVVLRRHLVQEFDDRTVEFFHGYVPGG